MFYDAMTKYYFCEMVAMSPSKFVSDAEKEAAKKEMDEHCYTMMLHHQRIVKRKERMAWNAACQMFQQFLNDKKAGGKNEGHGIQVSKCS